MMDYEVKAPTEYMVITSHKGMRDGQDHDGLDLRARHGTAIKAFKAGVVFEVKRSDHPNDPTGKYVSILCEHPKEIHKYFHMSEIDPSLQVGQHVSAGQQFALAGSTGNSEGPHLHFEIHRQNGGGQFEPMNPIELYPEHFQKYMDKETGQPVNIDRILKSSTRVDKPRFA
jgi:murein DD-endopeptidase MepM/ murein hydrolase activator NlpD